MNSKPVRIAYLLEYPLDLPGGAQMSTESLCMALLNEGDYFEPVVICPRLLNKEEKDYPFRIITYPMGDGRIKNLLIRIRAFHSILKREKFDIVHIQMPESLITYGLSFVRGRMIFTDRGLFYGYRRHSMLLMQRTLRKANMMLVTTDFNKKMWLEGSNIRPIEKVANTISDRFLKYDESIRMDKSGNEDGQPGILRIGLAGRICDEKDWPFAVRLIQMIADAGVSIKVKLVLSVFEAGDGEKVEAIIKGISEAIGKENLEFHQDYSQQQMADYYYGVDVFVMTSKFESFGKAAVEAMSRKCAVISTDVGGLSEVIGKKENLYTVDTPERAVEYIKRVDLDRELLKNEQEYFYQRYIDNFSQDRCLKDHIRIYNEVLQ